METHFSAHNSRLMWFRLGIIFGELNESSQSEYHCERRHTYSSTEEISNIAEQPLSLEWKVWCLFGSIFNAPWCSNSLFQQSLQHNSQQITSLSRLKCHQNNSSTSIVKVGKVFSCKYLIWIHSFTKWILQNEFAHFFLLDTSSTFFLIFRLQFRFSSRRNCVYFVESSTQAVTVDHCGYNWKSFFRYWTRLDYNFWPLIAMLLDI